MAPRASWKGFLNLSLVSVPVKAYTSSNSGGSVRLNQLHVECNSRINYKTVCPVCGEISRDQLVKGYEYAKDQYVVIDLDEMEKLRTKDEGRAIRINKFVDPKEIDPVYFSDTHYYLVPDGAAGHKPYSLLFEAMRRKGLYCVAQVVLHNKEQLVLVRANDDLLCMTVLKYASQVKGAEAFRDEIAEQAITDDEFALAETLIDETTAAEFDLTQFKDVYTERLTQLIESKVSGEQIVAAPQSEVPDVVNLMEALKASVAAAKGSSTDGTSKTPKAAPKKKAARSKSKDVLADQLANPKKKKATRKKKSG